jgi:hypothetical protein
MSADFLIGAIFGMVFAMIVFMGASLYYQRRQA